MTSGESTLVVECACCGLFQTVGEARPSHILSCSRCGTRVGGAPPGGGRLAIFASCVGVLLLTIALREPLFELHLFGRDAAAGVLAGPHALVKRGLPELATVVLFCMVLAPTLQLGIFFSALLGSHQRSRALLLPLGLIEAARRWSMTDVFLLASVVCYVRLTAWANVKIGGAIIALVALSFVSLTAERALDVRGMWQRLPFQPRSAGKRIACEWCGLVDRGQDGQACARCERKLHARKPQSLTRTVAFLLAAAFLSVPANMLPVMDMIRFGRPDSNTIFSGVIELTKNDLWGLAILIFVASIVIPAIKIVALAILVGMTARKRSEYLRGRTWTFRFVRDIGRWSLVDVFAVTLFVSLVHMGALASVLPRYGVVAFCGVVLLTMFATESFDPRLMWDAAGLNEERS